MICDVLQTSDPLINMTSKQTQPAQNNQSMFGNMGASLTQNNANSLGASFLGASTTSPQNFSQSAIGFSRSDMMPQRKNRRVNLLAYRPI